MTPKPTSTTVPVGEGSVGAVGARTANLITTDKAAGLIVLGALAFLVVLRRGFKGAVMS